MGKDKCADFGGFMGMKHGGKWRKTIRIWGNGGLLLKGLRTIVQICTDGLDMYWGVGLGVAIKRG